ncbi:MAG: phosphate ABC transporter substrate-binding/OmpA family protein [Cyanobacteria bacterium P01_G01_bin.38]
MSFFRNSGEKIYLASTVAVLGIVLGLFIAVFARAMPNLGGFATGQLSSATEDRLSMGNHPHQKTHIRVLGDTFSGYSTFRDATFQSALMAAGIELTYADEFEQSVRAQELNKNADIVVTTLDQFLQQQPAGKIVGLIDRTVGADAVVLNTQQYPELTSLESLKRLVDQAKETDKPLSIAFAADTPSEYLALVLDTKFEAFDLDDFELKELADASEVWEKMQDPQHAIAIGILWEPFVTQATDQNNAILLSSQDAPEAIIDVIVASDSLLESSPDVVSKFLEIYYRRIDASVQDAGLLEAQIAADGDLSPADATQIISGIDFFTAVEAQQWLSDGTLANRIDATAAVLAFSERISSVPRDISTLVSTSEIEIAARNSRVLAGLLENQPELAKRMMGEGQTVEATPQTVTTADIGNLTIEGQISFEIGTAQLTPASQTTLSKLAQQIKEFNQDTVALKIIGHTSSVGSANRNLQLSNLRAQAVASYLRKQGLKHKFQAEGKGATQPLPNTPPNDPKNQRTEIRLVRVNS